jgi:hypothetical protein
MRLFDKTLATMSVASFLEKITLALKAVRNQ